MHEHAGLLSNHLCNSGVTVPTPHSRYTGNQVEVAPARVVVEILFPALRDQQGLFVAMKVYRHKALAVVQDCLIRWTCVGLRCVINGGQLPHTESCYPRSVSKHSSIQIIQIYNVITFRSDLINTASEFILINYVIDLMFVIII